MEQTIPRRETDFNSLASFKSSLKPRSHQQQCRSNVWLCYQNGNNIEWVYRKISSFRQSRHELNMFNLFRLCRKDEVSFDIVAETGNIVAKNGNSVEATFDFTLSKESFEL